MSSSSLRFALIAVALAGACSHSDGVGTGHPDLANGVVDPGVPDFAELNTPATCTSGTMWTGGDRGNARMHPGAACISCHDANLGPSFTIAGTVFPSAHEPDDCNGASSAIQVVITGADGVVRTLTTNSSGNFYDARLVALPFTAKVVSGGKERAMLATQMSGDCNSCHTQNGDQGAPGRIVAP
jgi:hypothetical protein